MASSKSTGINNAKEIAKVAAYFGTPLGIFALIVIALYWMAYPSRSERDVSESVNKIYAQMTDPKSNFNLEFSKEVAGKIQASIQNVLEIKNKELFKGKNSALPIEGPFSDSNNSLKEMREKILPVINAIKDKTDKLETLSTLIPGSAGNPASSKSDLGTLKKRFDAVDMKLSEVEVLVKSYSPKQDSGINNGKTSDVDLGKLKIALKSDFDNIRQVQKELAQKLGEISSKVDGNVIQLGSKIDKLDKSLLAQQDVKKESKYQPVYMIVLSKGFKPQRDAIGFIVQKLATPDSNASSKASPTVLLSADGNRQGVLSMVGFNQVSLNTWLDNNDLREFKPQIDALPLIASDKINGGGQPHHMVVLLGHNVQLDKTKDLSTWEKLENLTFVIIEPPNLGNFSWDNLRKIKDVRKAKGRKTEIRIFKTANEMDSGFKLELDEMDDIAVLMKTSVAQ